MKKRFLLGFLALALLVSDGKTDISRLEPVETLQVITTEDGVRVLTDTGAKGYGSTLTQALENLHSSAPNRIFLETAQFLLVDDQRLLEELYPVLRPACRVYVVRKQADLEVAAKYLELHGPQITLGQYRAEKEELPIYYSKEGRSQIVY